MEIKLKDFTITPGGRYKKEGEFSGEEFRETLLSKYKQARENNEKLSIDMDGCYGLPVSFLEEAFGGLARVLNDRSILNHIVVICNDEPGVVNDIKKYIEGSNVGERNEKKN